MTRELAATTFSHPTGFTGRGVDPSDAEWAAEPMTRRWQREDQR
jgi:hypothetical protein